MSCENEKHEAMYVISVKKKYLLKRIKDEHDFLFEKAKEQGYGLDLSLVLSQSNDNFVYTAPETIDYYFRVLSLYITLNREEYNPSNTKRNVFIYRCFKCDEIGHVLKDCSKS